MSWLAILKNQQVLPTATYSLALALTNEEDFQKLLDDVNSAEALNPAGIRAVTSLKNKSEFVKNQFIKIYSQQAGTSLEEMWGRMERLLEAMKPKLGRKRERTRDKIISAQKNPEEYADFIAELRENPLTAEEIRELKSAKAREAYRRIMQSDESEADGIVMPFKFKAGEGVSKKQFTDTLILLDQNPKITRKGNNLVFDAKDIAEVARILRLGTKDRTKPTAQRVAFDASLKPFMTKPAQAKQIALPKTKVSEAMSQALLSDKEYKPKSNLSADDYLDYLEIISKANVAVAKYLPKTIGPGKGIADEAFSASKGKAMLSPYGLLLLKTDFNTNWKQQFFGNVKISAVLSRTNAEQAVITDILATLRATPVDERKDAQLYGTISLEPFAGVNLEKATKNRDATQNARSQIRDIISGSSRLTDMLNTQTRQKQSGAIGQMQKDPTLMKITEAIEAKKQNGGEILYYDSSLNQLEDTEQIQRTGEYAKVRVDGKMLTRDDINLDESANRQSLEQIRDILEDPTEGGVSLADIVAELISNKKIEKVLQSSGMRNRLEQVSVENGLIFLIEMGEMIGDETLLEALEKAVMLATKSREELAEQGIRQRRLRRELEGELDEVDESMPSTLETYKTGMLEALSVKLTQIGRDYEKFIGSSPGQIEKIIGSLVGAGLLEE